jgi:hypothetical protein
VSAHWIALLSDTLDMKLGPVIILFLFTFTISHSQAPNRPTGSPAQSSLTVTATVVPSVWLIVEPDGIRDAVVANAPDAKEPFFHAPAKTHGNGTAKKQTAPPTKSMRNKVEDAVQFTLPTPQRFDVSKETVMLDVSKDGKTSRRPVIVTTVVPQ